MPFGLRAAGALHCIRTPDPAAHTHTHKGPGCGKCPSQDASVADVGCFLLGDSNMHWGMYVRGCSSVLQVPQPQALVLLLLLQAFAQG